MSETVEIRVMADGSAAEGVAERIVGALGENDGLTLVKRSRPYPCRPPEQGKVRIYLTFAPGDSGGERGRVPEKGTARVFQPPTR